MEGDQSLDLLTEDNSALVIEANETHILTDTVKWARFFAIGSLIMGVLFVLILLMAGVTRYNYIRTSSANNSTTILIWISYLMIAVIMVVFLLRFCIFCRRAISNEDIVTFNDALAALKYYFIVSGIGGMLYLLFTIMQYAKKI